MGMNKSDPRRDSIPRMSSPKSVTMYKISRRYIDDKQWHIAAGLDKMRDYRSSWLRCVNRKPRNRFPSVMRSYGPKNRKNQGRPQKRLLDVVRSELVNSWPNDNDGECQGRKDVTL
jgi:hypothetical protein